MNNTLPCLYVMDLGVLIIERCYASCKKVYLRRTGRAGFQLLPTVQGSIEDEEDEEAEQHGNTGTEMTER